MTAESEIETRPEKTNQVIALNQIRDNLAFLDHEMRDEIQENMEARASQRDEGDADYVNDEQRNKSLDAIYEAAEVIQEVYDVEEAQKEGGDE